MRGALRVLAGERRSILEQPGQPITSEALAGLTGAPGTSAGVNVTPTGSLRMSAVYRCVTVISGVASALPMPVYRLSDRKQEAHPLLDNPHPEMTDLELWRLTYVHRALWGNAYLQKLRARSGRVGALWPIRPERVTPVKIKPSNDLPGGKLFQVTDDDGRQQVLGPDEILHLPHLGYDGVKGLSPIRLAAQGIGLGLAAEEYGARLFGSGTQLSGILVAKEKLTDVQAESLRRRWRAKMAGLGRSHEVGVLDSNVTFQPLTMPNSDAQFLESRQFTVRDVARFYGVPPFLLGETEKSTSWGTGLEQQSLGWVMYDLHPTWLAPTERRITKELLAPAHYTRYKVQGLLRGDSAARSAYYRVMREIGTMNSDEIRELEDLPPLADGTGQTYFQPANMVPLGTAPASAAPPRPDREDQPA